MKKSAIGAWLVVLLTVCLPASAHLSTSTIGELAEQASDVYVVTVNEVLDPRWKDETGQRVLLAIATVESIAKGTRQKDLTFVFKPNVADQAHFSAGQRYLTFIYGLQRPIVMQNQSVAFRIDGTEVETELLRDEPKRQQLDSVLDRVRGGAKK